MYTGSQAWAWKEERKELTNAANDVVDCQTLSFIEARRRPLDAYPSILGIKFNSI